MPLEITAAAGGQSAKSERRLGLEGRRARVSERRRGFPTGNRPTDLEPLHDQRVRLGPPATGPTLGFISVVQTLVVVRRKSHPPSSSFELALDLVDSDAFYTVVSVVPVSTRRRVPPRATGRDRGSVTVFTPSVQFFCRSSGSSAGRTRTGGFPRVQLSRRGYPSVFNRERGRQTREPQLLLEVLGFSVRLVLQRRRHVEGRWSVLGLSVDLVHRKRLTLAESAVNSGKLGAEDVRQHPRSTRSVRGRPGLGRVAPWWPRGHHSCPRCRRTQQLLLWGATAVAAVGAVAA